MQKDEGKKKRLRQYVYVAPACSITGALQDHPGKVPLFVSDRSRKLPASNRRICSTTRRDEAPSRLAGDPTIRNQGMADDPTEYIWVKGMISSEVIIIYQLNFQYNLPV